MGYKFNCQRCGNEIIVKYCFIGEAVQCKTCKAENIVPEDALETDEEPGYLLRNETSNSNEKFEEKEIVVTPGPLGPRDFGEIIVETFRIYKKNFLKFVAIVGIIASIVYTPIIILTMVALLQYLNKKAPVWFLPVVILYTMLCSIITTPLEICAIVYAVSENFTQKTITIGHAYKWAFSRLKTAIGAELLAGLIYFGLIITVLGIPYGVYLSYLWTFMFPVALVEGATPRRILSRSSFLVKNDWWRVFGITVVISIICMGIISAFRIIPLFGLLIGVILATPIHGICLSLLYFDLRVRKEGYTLEKLAEELKLNISPSASKK